ncbi:MAG: GNAT family N-acetyltransferase, partial [Thermosulfidibacteraceae bacterium]
MEDYIKAYSDLKEYKYTSKKDIKNYFKWLYKRDKEGFFVAEVDGKIVGFAAGDANWINSEGEKVLEIHEIFVIPEMRGKGIGTK